jgi:NADPH-dependent 2,4-dienoyl-CoA reductase/sulfur reductase-like enzyme
MTDLVVVGASLAGLRAAEAARRANAGRVTLLGAEPHLPYDRPPLSKAFLAAGAEHRHTRYREEQVLRDELGIELRLGCPATGLSPERRTVQVGPDEISYDGLVIATGARARTLNTGGLAGIHTLRGLDDALALRAELDRANRVVVVGAGFIGSELAAAARARGLPVTIVESAPTPLVRAVGAQVGQLTVGIHEARGTEVRCGVGVAGFSGAGHRVEAVRLTDGSELPADLVVVGIGADPETAWLAGSGLDLTDGVVCDETLAAGPAGVYAAGDVASWVNPMFGRRMRLEHWTSAAEQGAVAARNALDPAAATAYRTVPYFWSDWYDVKLQMVGVPTADEVLVLDGDGNGRIVALYRAGDRVVGAFAVNGQAVIMKYRAMITRAASWIEALDLAEQRGLAPAAMS